jgi:dipeptidyl-peptidase-4
VIYDVETKTRRAVVEASSPSFAQFSTASSYEFSADGKHILLSTQLIKLYRHSFLATWQVYTIESDTITDIVVNNDLEPFYRLAKFGPASDEMIVVDKSNLYYKASPSSEAVAITKDIFNATSVKFNGVPDWVYEEEIFSSNSATWFSTDGKKAAFIQFDDTAVPTIALSLYGTPGAYKYPETIPVSYPKAGAKNPAVKLFSVDFENIDPDNLPQITPPSLDADHLIISVAWANANDLISVWTNRVQNRGFVYKCTGAACENILTLDKDDGWIEFPTEPFFNKEGNEMIFIGSNDGYRHVKALNLETKVLASRTSGKFIVTEILKFNKEHNLIIYTANTEDDIKAQHIYAIKNENSATPTCLTCNLHSGHTYYSAEASEGGSHLVITASGPEVPRVDLYTLKVDGDKIELSDHAEIENNNGIRSTLEGKSLPRKVYDTIKFDDGSEAYVMMLLPKNLNENENVKYPILVDVYGGPDSTSVTNRFSIEWGTYLASSLGIVYAKIDGRGSGLRSDAHLHALYKNLGTVEVDDQGRTVQKLLEKYPYLDASRTGIWGNEASDVFILFSYLNQLLSFRMELWRLRIRNEFDEGQRSV